MNQIIRGNRRLARRYDLALEVRWNLRGRNRLLDAGTGRTVNLSSGGVLFESDCHLPVGLKVELLIEWPSLLHDTHPLQLRVAGTIVRADGLRLAVRMVKRQLLTSANLGGRRGRGFQRAVDPPALESLPAAAAEYLLH
jgi:PilZ domain